MDQVPRQREKARNRGLLHEKGNKLVGEQSAMGQSLKVGAEKRF